MNPLFIYGAGGFGKEVMDVARRANRARPVTAQWSDIYFVDDITPDTVRYGATVYRFADAFVQSQLANAEFVIAVGEPAGREKLAQKLAAAGAKGGRVVDTSTLVADSANMQEGTVITPLCSVSSDARIGLHACVNTMSIVGHDVTVGDYAVVSSMVNIGGGCSIGTASYLGMGALIKEGVRIGRNVIVGMGSVVYSDIPDDVIALGNPARPMRPNTDRKVFK